MSEKPNDPAPDSPESTNEGVDPPVEPTPKSNEAVGDSPAPSEAAQDAGGDRAEEAQSPEVGSSEGGFSQVDIDALLNAQSPGMAAASAQSASSPEFAVESDDAEISQADIDALLNAQNSDTSHTPAAPSAAADDGEISQADIDALLSAASGGSSESAQQGGTAPVADDDRLDSAGRPFDDTAAMIAAEMAEAKAASKSQESPATPAPASAAEPVQAKPADLPSFDSPKKSAGGRKISMLNDVNLQVSIELGRTNMLIEDVLRLGENSVVELDRLAGDPVDVFVNGRLIARGEVLVLNDNFCVRVSELVNEQESFARSLT